MLAPKMIHQNCVRSKWFYCILSQFMMAAASDNLNRNGGTGMGMGGVDSTASNLIIRLLLVSDPIFLLGVSILVERVRY